jgi:glycine betaine/proline transport system substrate-binding protein
VNVRLGRATWDTGWFQAHIFNLLFEELGYSVRMTEPLDNLTFYFFSGQGDVDLWANGWFPNHDRYFDYTQVADLVRPVGFQVEGGALQGYLVDKASADELGITNLIDFKDPEIASVFDNDGDGKADLIGCNVGWGCEQIIEQHLDVYGLRDTVAHIQGEYSELIDGAVSAQRNGKPILFYTWTPNWTLAELTLGQDVVWLGVPFSAVPDNSGANSEAKNIAGCLESPCNMGFEPNDIRVVASVAFLESNPAAAKLVELVEIPLADIAAQNQLMRNGENSEDDLRRHAEAWIKANKEIVNEWLKQARGAAQ